MERLLPHYIRGRDGVYLQNLSIDDVKVLDTSSDGRNCDLIRRFLLAWQALLADQPKQCGKKPLELFRSFEKYCLSQPLITTITTFASYGDKILESCTDDALTGIFLPEMLKTPVAREYITWFKTGDPSILSYLITFLWFGKKLRIDDPDLSSIALKAWWEVEDRLRTIALPSEVLHDLKIILETILPPLDISEADFGHGPGSVSERSGVDVQWKNRNLRFHPKLDRAFVKQAMRKARLDEGYLRDEEIRQRSLIIPDEWERGRDNIALRSSDVDTWLTVPKSVKTARTICKVPVTFMYFQQGVRKAMERAFTKSSIRRFVRIDSQERNQILSGLGSQYAHLDTIDLASASDSVSWQLVSAIMPRTWKYYLQASRTSLVNLPEIGKVRVRKFAPMGSACCFPTQSIVFLAVVLREYIVHSMGPVAAGRVRPGDVRSVLSKIDDTGVESIMSTQWLAAIAVYGDDIILDSRVTDNVITTLESLGFRVNHGKSFRGTQLVRESCGKFWYNGFDITPTLFRVKPSKFEKLDPESLASIIANANNARTAGLYALQSLLIRWALFDSVDPNFIVRDRSGGIKGVEPYSSKYLTSNPVLFSDDPRDGFSLTVSKPVNSHLKSYYDGDLHLFVYRRWVLSDERDADVGGDGMASATSGKTGYVRSLPVSYPNEHYAYARWWSRFSSIDPDGDNIPRRVDRTSVSRVLLAWASSPK